jgi:sugar lactone lactonase YvrE
MKPGQFTCTVFLFLAVLILSSVSAADKDDKGDKHQFPQDATFTTLITTPRAIEGLTGDNAGNLYTGGAAITSLGDTFCPVWRINPSSSTPSLILVGKLPTPCSPVGITFNETGDLFVADGANAKIWTFTPNAGTPPTATAFATGVPGANAVAFDQDGNLWNSDGVTGQGRVWKITGLTADCTLGKEKNCVEVFRIQPMAATTDELQLSFPASPTFGSSVTSVGSDRRTLPPGTLGVVNNAVRIANNIGGSQPLVANGLAFTRKGDLFIIDTARGALWKVEFDRHGDLKSPTGCDPVFTPNTLCLSNILVAHPTLEGGDGIALDKDENIWVDANERNAVAVVTKKGEVLEIFRNPLNDTHLRNAATNVADNIHILEFPTSPFLAGKLFCTSQSDGNRRDNSPRDAGEIDAGNTTGTGKDLGKISCMDQELKIGGLPLPVH